MFTIIVRAKPQNEEFNEYYVTTCEVKANTPKDAIELIKIQYASIGWNVTVVDVKAMSLTATYTVR